MSLSPSYVDTTECQYFWPYCTQPLYYTSLPAIFNVTLLNGMGVSGSVAGPPTWHPYTPHMGHYLDISLTHSDHIWPWAGWIAVQVNWIGMIEQVVASQGECFYGTFLSTFTQPQGQ